MGTKPKQPKITMKKIGNNLIALIDGKSTTRVLKTDEEKTKAKELLELVKAYQTKPTKATLAAVEDFINPNKKIEEAKETKIKATKKAIKHEKKSSKTTGKAAPKAKKNLAKELKVDINELNDEDAHKLLDELKERFKTTQVVTQVEAKVASTVRRGEY